MNSPEVASFVPPTPGNSCRARNTSVSPSDGRALNFRGEIVMVLTSRAAWTMSVFVSTVTPSSSMASGAMSTLSRLALPPPISSSKVE